MGEKGLIVQIDESIFQGKRKYNRGRLRLGDCKPVDNEDTDGRLGQVVLPILPRIILTKKIITIVLIEIMAAEFKDLGCQACAV